MVSKTIQEVRIIYIKKEGNDMDNITHLPINQIFQKVVRELPVSTNKIRSPHDGVEIVKELISNADREHFVILSLSNKYNVISINICHIGSLNTCIVHPREVFKDAILSNAAAIFIAHNHPSQDLSPSEEDITMTKRLIEAGEIIGIEVLDHIIVNNKNEYYSMKSLEDI